MIEVANHRGGQPGQGMPGQMPGLAADDDDVEDIAPPAELAVRQQQNEDEEDGEDDEDDEEEVEAAVSAWLAVFSDVALTLTLTALAGAFAP